MVFGSCCFVKNGELNEMNAKSVTINGIQRGLIFNFEVTQTFVHYESDAQEINYIFPNDLKICIYDTTFIVGKEIIKPKLKAKEEAYEIYKEAVSAGRTAIYGSNIDNGLTQFKLGNVMPNIECKVILQISFIAQQTNEKTFYIKFPIDVYTPNGSKGCLNLFFSNFLFKIQCDSEKVKNVKSNVKNGQFDNNSKLFTIAQTIDNDDNQRSIIVTFETYDQIKSSVFVGSKKQSNFNCCAVTISPSFGPSIEKNYEFVFLVDCSCSMEGSSIGNARKCLQTFIKNLPKNSLFNIFRFGSHFSKLFKCSQILNSTNKYKAIELSNNLRADLGGTDIYTPLTDIFSQQVSKGQRQIFLITDGEVYNVPSILSLARKNSYQNRIFSIGIGRGCDAGLVEGIANVTGGKSDFVQVGDSIDEKLLSQLRSSFQPVIRSIEVHVSGQDKDSFEISPYPIPNISPGSCLVFFLRSKNGKNNEKQNPFEDGILVTARYGKESIEIPINEIEDASSIENSFLPLFAFKTLLKYEYSDDLSDNEKKRSEELSISSGVLCKFTGFVGMTEVSVLPKFDESLCYPCRCSPKKRRSNVGSTVPEVDIDESDHLNRFTLFNRYTALIILIICIVYILLHRYFKK